MISRFPSYFLTLVLVGGLAARSLVAAPPDVSNVQILQREGAKLVDISYDLSDPDTSSLTVSVEASDDGGTTYDMSARTLSGDFGSGVSPGTGKQIVWDAGEDWEADLYQQVRVRVTASDGVDAVPAGYSLISRGTFTMGSPTDELGRDSDETQHQVTLTRDFFLQTTEVTNAQMAEVINWALGQGLVSASSSSVRNTEGSEQELLDLDGFDSEISLSGGVLVVDAGKEEHPCVEVTWYGAQAYCNYLSDREGLTRAIDFSDWSVSHTVSGNRLPTEGEWEYACRAGTTTAFFTGEITERECGLDPNLDAAGWYCGNSDDSSHGVGQKQANGWGLFDTHGNVWEWCGDWYGSYSGDATDPVGPLSGASRVFRGGSWRRFAQICRSASRSRSGPSSSSLHVGFRPARSSVP